MSDQVQWRGGSRQNSDQFTGAPREVTVDTSDWILRVHDGVTPGGHKMMKVNDCLQVETADKCNPNVPSCKVIVNGELEVNGGITTGPGVEVNLDTLNVSGCIANTSEADIPVLICDDLKVSGHTDLQSGLLVEGNAIFDKNVVIEKGLHVDGTTVLDEVKVQGCIQHVGDQPIQICDDAKVSGSVKVEGDLWVDGDWLNIDDSKIPLKTPNLSWGCDTTGCCLPAHPDLMTVEDKLNWLDIATKALEDCHCQLKALNELAHEHLEQEIDQLKKLIALLELQIQNILNNGVGGVTDHDLNYHSDVSIGSPSEDELFVYKNGKWTNQRKCFATCNTYIPSLIQL